ncbi:MAG: non-homologous end-joining DNA ligase [Nannocystaceae bacterium]
MDCDEDEDGEGISFTVTHPEKVLFPRAKITKGALIDYYEAASPWMLPHLRDRPLTLHRFPSGVDGRGFYHKQIEEDAPRWIERCEMGTRDGEPMTYALGNNGATLIHLANKNTIAFHVTASRCGDLDRPDLFILDLDPSDDDFEKVRLGARHLGSMMAAMGLVPFVKTTGSRGLHVVAAIEPDEGHEQVREHARALAERLCRRDPERFTIDTVKKRRGDRVFVDYLRNGVAQTMVAPYSVRAIDGAPVSTPITWTELEDPALHGRTFTVRDVPGRLRTIGDPWREIRSTARSLRAARVQLDAMR